MEFLKGYAITILAVVLFSALCEMFLPEGRMKKYSASLIGLAVAAAILSPISRITGTEIRVEDFLPEYNIAADENKYQTELAREYEKRITERIYEEAEGGITCSVLVDPESMEIKKIYIKGSPDGRLISFIVNELGVLENDIEINQ